MTEFASIFQGKGSTSDLQAALNKELDSKVVGEVRSSLLDREGGDNKAGLVYSSGLGSKLKVELFRAGSMANLEQLIADWTSLNPREIVDVALTYGGSKTRAMVSYRPDVGATGYTVKAVSAGSGSGMTEAVNDLVSGSAEVIVGTCFGNDKYRAVVIAR